MSHSEAPTGRICVKTWTILCLVVNLFLLSMFTFGGHYLHWGKHLWNAVRAIFSPII